MAEAGGADMAIIYNSGRYRMAGRGSLAGMLAYGDANAIVVEMAAEVLPVVRDMPVLAGINGTDPFRIMRVFLRQLKEMGFDGVQNFPTVGLIDGDFRRNLEATGMGYDKEVEAIAIAHELDLFTSPYVFDPGPGDGDGRGRRRPARRARRPHDRRLDRGRRRRSRWTRSSRGCWRSPRPARRVRDDIIVLCHGGPLDEPAQVGEALPRMPGVHGFFGASSIERLPTERAIRGQVQDFKRLAVARPDGARRAGGVACGDDGITILPATPDRWDDVASILGGDGDKGCWCQAWRGVEVRGEPRPDALRRQLAANEVPPGFLAYLDGEVVGWAGVSVRTQTPRLVNSRTIPAVDDLPVWSIGCFRVRPGYPPARGRGCAAGRRGPGGTGGRRPGRGGLPDGPGRATRGRRAGFVGLASMFDRAGFRRVLDTSAHSAGLPRLLVRLDLTG